MDTADAIKWGSLLIPVIVFGYVAWHEFIGYLSTFNYQSSWQAFKRLFLPWWKK